MTIGQRFVYLFATPWWRLVWFLGALVWCVVLNAIFITGGGTNQWIGIASVLPIWAFAFDVARRSLAIDRTKPSTDS